ncbi:MAG: hypothetical protein IPL39_21490 [Opitutaceae bacterium]|nr:hypothetical protein [Opitutaceae bacterium]
MQFSYLVQADDLDLDGIVISGIDLNFGSFTDSGGWRALPALRNIGDTSGVLVAPQVNYDIWAAAAFTADELADPAISGPDADPDGSGVKNLMRYALELPARGPVTVPAIVTYAGGSNPATLTLSFVMRAHGNDLRYAVMASEDLVAWTEKRSDSPYGVRLAIDASVPVPAGAKRFFLRLEIVTK